MEIRFNGKAALVTEAGCGVGAAIAVAPGAAGAQVAIHYNSNRPGAEKVCADIRARGGPEALLLTADLMDPQAIPAMVSEVAARLGRIDILVDNAGGLLDRRTVSEMPDKIYEQVMELNMGSAFRVSRAVIPL